MENWDINYRKAAEKINQYIVDQNGKPNEIISDLVFELADCIPNDTGKEYFISRCFGEI